MRPSRIARNLLVLPRLLREAGVAVDAERARLYLRGLAEIDLGREEDVRAACRALLVRHPADLARFEETFDLFWDIVRGARPYPAATERAARRRAEPVRARCRPHRSRVRRRRAPSASCASSRAPSRSSGARTSRR